VRRQWRKRRRPRLRHNATDLQRTPCRRRRRGYLGNPSRNRREAFQFIEDAPHLIRPINYLSGTPGRGAALIETKTGGRTLVINALGRLFMEPVEDPFGRIGVELDANPLGRGADAIRHRLPLRACAPGDRKI
jgi:hypothetical protein